MLNGGSMVWGFCVYIVYMIPLETDVLRKHRFQKTADSVSMSLLMKNNGKYIMSSVCHLVSFVRRVNMFVRR